jgi:two-component system response regulator
MSQKFVLLIEDSPDDEALTLRALKKSNIKYEVIVIRDGAEALDFLFCRAKHSSRNIQELPEVILLDLKLPKLNGHQVLEQIRAHAATHLLPVIILTSSREEKDLQQSYAGGANSYVVKPVDSEQFEESIRQMGLYWLTLNESLR